jgi:hypothetical protein
MAKRTLTLTRNERSKFKEATERVRALARATRQELWDASKSTPDSVGVGSDVIANAILFEAQAILRPHQNVSAALLVRKLVYEVNQHDAGEDEDVRSVRFETPLFDGISGLPPWICIRRGGEEGYKPIRESTPCDLDSARKYREEMADAHYVIRDKITLVVDTARLRGCPDDEPVGNYLPGGRATGSSV